MSFSAQAIKSFLKKGEIRKLFIEGLGWDGGKSTKDCKVDEVTYGLKEVAVKAGFKVWLCEMTGQRLPSREQMKAVHRQLVKESYEHIIIFFCPNCITLTITFTKNLISTGKSSLDSLMESQSSPIANGTRR